MVDANQACENIRATGNVNYGFYDYYSNYGCTKPTQYRFEYTAQWDEYVVDCYNLEATEIPDVDNNPFYFSMHAQKVAPKNDNLFTYQISFDDAASAYQSSVDTYKLPGFKYRFYHFDTPPDLPSTDLEGATLVHAGNAGGNLNAGAGQYGGPASCALHAC